MSKISPYAPYIPLVTGFHITSANLIDNRTVVETIEDRDAISSVRLPDGLECLVMDQVRAAASVVKWRWYDGMWHPITSDSSGGGDDFNYTVDFTIATWIEDVDKPYNKYYIEVAHTGSKHPAHRVFKSTGEDVSIDYKEISTSIFRLYCRHPFDGTLTAN